MKRWFIVIVIDALLAAIALTVGVSPVWARAVVDSGGAAAPATFHTSVALTIAAAVGLIVVAPVVFLVAARIGRRDPLAGAPAAHVPERVAAGPVRPVAVARPSREPKAA